MKARRETLAQKRERVIAELHPASAAHWFHHTWLPAFRKEQWFPRSGDSAAKVRWLQSKRVYRSSKRSLLFACLYLPGMIGTEDLGWLITLGDHQLEFTKWADRTIPLARSERDPDDCRVITAAPRGSGKSTWLFNVIPIWAACHGHLKTIYGVGVGKALESNLKAFRTAMLRGGLDGWLHVDYPEATTYKKSETSAALEEDNKLTWKSESGFTFRVGDVTADHRGLIEVQSGDGKRSRVDLVIWDDGEQDGDKYTPRKVANSIHILTHGLIPLGGDERDLVLVTGTSTQVDSMIHQAVKTITEGTTVPWIKGSRFRVLYAPAIVDEGLPTEHSIWSPWRSLEWLQREREENPDVYATEYLNDPKVGSGEYWSRAMFKWGAAPPAIQQEITMQAVDPNTKFGDKYHDETAAVIATLWHDADDARIPWKIHVREAGGWRPVSYGHQRDLIDLQRVDFDTRIYRGEQPVAAVKVEGNQGGDLWLLQFAHLVERDLLEIVYRSSDGRPAGSPLDAKQWHAAPVAELTRQGVITFDEHLRDGILFQRLTSFPYGADDLVDAFVSVVEQLLKWLDTEYGNVGPTLTRIGM